MASNAEQIVDAVGGPGNVISLTHCATRLRFELKDASGVDQKAVEKIPGVLGAVPQSGDRYQVVIGGAVQTVFNEIMNLPSMAGAGKAAESDADVKARERAKARGKVAWLDSFFEYLSDSFRPLLGVLLGTSLIIAIAAVLDATGVVGFQGINRLTDLGMAGGTWTFWDAMWRSVLYFLPIMVAYNASKKMNVDPWLGAAIIAALFTPEFMNLSSADAVTAGFTTCTVNETLGTSSCVAQIFGLPMQLNGYGGQVFVPLLMVPILAVLYRGLKKIFPENLQMVFVPFLSLLVMIPLTAFLIGPLSIWIGNGLGFGLAWLNTTVPLLFAILIPMLYPFLVPLGLHWPLNALMLANIATLGYDFIQGPMGTWNFACFGATAGVLVLSSRIKDDVVRQTSIGALAAGLLGGISEPSLYGIHLRFKRIYPRMLLGCAAGGLTIGLLEMAFGQVKTGAFAFTSLLTIPVFSPMWVYAISIAVAFGVAMFAVLVSGYRTKEELAEFKAEQAQAAADMSLAAAPVAAPAAAAATGTATLVATQTVGAPISGTIVPLADVKDPVFSSKALGEGVGIEPDNGLIVAPVSGELVTVTDSGHAFGLRTDDGVEVLVHVGIDTVQLAGKGFEVAVAQGQRVRAGDKLATVDLGVVKAAGFATTTIVVVTNTAAMNHVLPLPQGTVSRGQAVIDVTPGPSAS